MNDKNSRLWFSLFVLVVFVGGLGTGVLLARVLTRPGPPFGGRPPVGRGGFGRGMVVDRLAADLNLTSDQKERVRVILDERQKRLEAINREVRGRFDAEQRELRDEIAKVLTPEQQPRFEQWLRSQPNRIGPGFPGRGRGGFGPRPPSPPAPPGGGEPDRF